MYRAQKKNGVQGNNNNDNDNINNTSTKCIKIGEERVLSTKENRCI